MAMQDTDWLAQALGQNAEDVQRESVAALLAAHDEALASHEKQRSRANDTYGHTLRVRSHELLNERLGAISGIALRRPRGVRSRFEFPVIVETNTVIVPLRYSTDPRVRHGDVTRITLSALRSALLTGPTPPEEPSLFDFVADEHCQDRYFEDLADYEELASAGRAIVLGYGSTTAAGIFEMGLGELLIDNPQTGAVSWRPGRWWPLHPDLALTKNTESTGLSLAQSSAAVARFDVASGSNEDPANDLGLSLRRVKTTAPDPEQPQDGGSAAEHPQDRTP